MANPELSLTPRDIVRTLFKRRWNILVVFLSAAIVGLLVCFLMPPIYQAESQLLLDRAFLDAEKVRLSGESPALSTNIRQINQRDEINTEIELVKSRDLTVRVIDEVKLTRKRLDYVPDYRRYVRMTYNGAKSLVRNTWNGAKYLLHLSKRPTPEQIREREYEELVSRVGRALRVEQLHDSDVIEVAFRCSDPSLAQTMSRSFCSNAISWHVGIHRQAADLPFFQKQQEETQAKLEQIEKEMADARKNLDLIGAERRLDLLVEYQLGASNRYDEILAQKAALSAGIDNLKQALADEPEEIFLSRQTQRSPLLESIERGTLMGVNSLRQNLRQTMLVKSSELAAAEAQAKETESQLAQYRKRLLDLNDQVYRIKVLERQRESLQETYNLYLKNTELARLDKDRQRARLANLVMVQSAGLPLKPKRPRKWLYLTLAMAGGLILGVGWAFVREAADTTYWNPNDLATDTDIPLLGALDRI